MSETQLPPELVKPKPTEFEPVAQPTQPSTTPIVNSVLGPPPQNEQYSPPAQKSNEGISLGSTAIDNHENPRRYLTKRMAVIIALLLLLVSLGFTWKLHASQLNSLSAVKSGVEQQIGELKDQLAAQALQIADVLSGQSEDETPAGDGLPSDGGETAGTEARESPDVADDTTEDNTANDLTVNYLTVNHNAQINELLTVGRNTTLDENLSVRDDTHIGDDLFVGDDLVVGDTLQAGYTVLDRLKVKGSSLFEGLATFEDIHVTDDATIDDDLTVGGVISGDGSGLTSVDADTLDGNDSTFYQNADNINAGTLSSARLSFTSGDGAGATSSGSGLETSGSSFGLLQGCSDSQVLKWTEATSVWACAGDVTGGAASLQAAYDGGNTIATTDARDISVTLANTTTDADFIINVATGSTGEFKIQNNGSDTFTVTGSGAVTAASFSGSGSGLTSLNASNISSGTVADARLSGNVTLQGNTFNGSSQLVQTTAGGALPTISGTNLTSLNASNISSGTLADARLSANVALLNGTGPQTFTGNNKFTGTLLHQNASNSTTSFQVQNAAGTTLLGIDTTNSKIFSSIADGASAIAFTLNTSTSYNTNGAKLISIQNNGTEKFYIDKDGFIGQEAWHEVGTGGQPAFQNSWVNYDVTWASAAFMKDSSGFVHLKGLVKNGTKNSLIFTLPSGYRPAKNSLFATLARGSGGADADTVRSRITVGSSGTVGQEEYFGDVNNWQSLDGITFKAEQ